MRVSTAHQFATYSQGIQSSQQRVFDIQRRIQSGKQIEKPSDNPFGSVQVVSMRSLKSSLEQYTTNLNLAKGSLSIREQALGDMNDIAARGYQLSVQASTATLDTQTRMGLANEVSEMQRRLVDLANTKGPTGRYLFGGWKTDTQPYTAAGGTITYQGDANSVLSEVAANQTIPITSTGQPVVDDLYTRLEAFRQRLLTNQGAAIGDLDIAALTASREAIGLERSLVGSQLRTVESLETQHQRRTDELTQRTSELEDIDLTEAITEYRSADAAYQAALTVASQGFRLSLMDFMR